MRSDIGAGGVGVVVRQVEFEHLALADAADAGKAEADQRVLDGLTLGVEHSRLKCYMNARLQGTVVIALLSGLWRSRGPASGRMPRRRATS